MFIIDGWAMALSHWGAISKCKKKASENVKARDKEREIDACKKQSQKHPIQDISVRVQTEKWNHLEIQI